MSGAPRDLFTGGEFIAVRRDAIEALGSWEAAGVWHRICWRSEATGSWTATIGDIARECCLSEHKTQRALQEIRDAGWLTSVRAHARDATLAWTPVWSDENPASPDTENPVQETGDFQGTLFSETEETNQTAARAQKKPDLAAEFVEFYALYPRRTARGAAETKYRAARRIATRDEIIAGLSKMLPLWVDTDVRFIPHPATWLHQQRWLDEVEAPATAPSGSPYGPRIEAPDGLTPDEWNAWYDATHGATS